MPPDQNPNLRQSLDTPIMKKRRGRQPRQSLVSSTLLKAITKLTRQLGAPILLEEEEKKAFRDISGWLSHIEGTQFRSAWLSLCESYISESESFEEQNLDKLKEDLVQEIIKLVITRNPQESPKVVNTNARRQSKLSNSGQTVRNIFETYLAEVKETHDPSAKKHRSERTEAGSSHSHARLPRRHAVSSRASSSRSPGSMVQEGGSGIEISSLLTNDRHPVKGGSSSSSSGGGAKLPSMTQFDEEIRVRSEKDHKK